MADIIEPGCDTCYRRDDCPLASIGLLCTRWRSAPPAPAGEDPNDRWRRGDEDWDGPQGV